MWVVWFFLGFLVLALAIPLALSLVPVWRGARPARIVKCPEASKSVTVRLDPWYAVTMHARGNPELRLQDCTEWPQRAGCDQGCLRQIVPK